MYQFTINSDNIRDFKKAIADIYNELHGGLTVEKELTSQEIAGENVDLPPVIEKPVTPPALPEVDEDGAEIVEEITFKDEETPLASITPPVTTPAHVSNVELDSEGIPWDIRIHSRGKTKLKKDNSWKLKKGVDVALVDSVKAELKNKMQNIGSAPQVPPTPINANTPIINSPITNPGGATLSSSESLNITNVAPPVQPQVNVPPTVQPQVNVPPPVQPQIIPDNQVLEVPHTFESFKRYLPMILVRLINDEILDEKYMNDLKAYFGVTNVFEASEAHKLELFESFIEYGYVQRMQ